MLADGRAVGFVLTTDAERARSFYEGTLGLEFVEDNGFATVFRAGPKEGGATLMVTRIKSFSPGEHTVFGWEVDDVGAIARQLGERGVTAERYGYLEQDESGVWAAPDGRVRLIWFKDPDGNVLSAATHAS